MEQPNIIERLQGKDYPSFWKDGTFENLHDKRRNANSILRDTSRLIDYVNNEQGAAADPRTIKHVAKLLYAGHIYVNKIVIVYVGEEFDIKLKYEEHDPFDKATSCHSALQFNIEKLNALLPELDDPDKLDRLCTRLIRACRFFHTAHIYFESTERNIHGY